MFSRRRIELNIYSVKIEALKLSVTSVLLAGKARHGHTIMSFDVKSIS